MADTKIWWKELPCHYHPSWNLHKIRQKDLNTLKNHINRNILNDFMVVERLLYEAFLEVPVGSLYNLSLPSISKAHEHLQEAEKYVEDTYKQNEDAKVGYGIVINAGRMWISQSTREWEKKLQGLKKKLEKCTKSEHYMSAVRAFTLSKLGPEWLQEAFDYYEKAIKGIPENSHWLLETASLRVQLVRLKDPTMKSEDSIKRLTYSESLVKQALKFDKNFHAARALLVRIFSAQGRSEEAEKEAKMFTKQVIKDTATTNTAEILCEYYIKRELQKKAKTVIMNVPEKQRTAEQHYLLGFLNKSEARLNSALLDAGRALKADARHYPALRLRAEVNVVLKNYRKAQEQYADLLSSNLLDEPHLREDKFRTLESVLTLTPQVINEILTDDEYINYSSELLNIAVSEYSERNAHGIDFNDFAKGPVQRCTKALEEMCEREDNDSENCFLAKLKLAHFYLQLEQYEKAETLYRDLRSKTSPILRENVEVLWGIFKCLLGKSLYENAKQLVEDIEKENQTFYRSEELYADIYTTRAISQLKQLGGVTAEVVFPKDDDDPHSIACSIEQAIEIGSLEACFMFFTIDSIDKLRKHFLEFMRIPRIVAKVQRVSNEEIGNVHTDFPTERYVPKRDSSITTKRNILKENIEELLRSRESGGGEFTAYQTFVISNVHTKLSKLRKNLLKFEDVASRKSNGTVGNKEREDAFSEVLLTARFLLDHITSDYQDALIGDSGKKPDSNFFIISHGKGKIDKKTAENERNAWLIEKFPNCQDKVSDGVRKLLLEVQPMYAEKNLWLIAVHYYVNALKHQGGRKRNKKSSNTAVSDLLKDENKENLARTCCKEVENIVLQILAAIKAEYVSTPNLE